MNKKAEIRAKKRALGRESKAKKLAERQQAANDKFLATPVNLRYKEADGKELVKTLTVREILDRLIHLEQGIKHVTEASKLVTKLLYSVSPNHAFFANMPPEIMAELRGPDVKITPAKSEEKKEDVPVQNDSVQASS